MKSILIAVSILFSPLFAVASATAGSNFHPSASNVALTFDDGPDPRYTPRILEILAEHKIHATFFVLGSSAKTHPDLIRAIKAGGHSIANHSYTHPNLKHLSVEAITKELRKTNEVILEITGESPKCLRPPYGALNASVRSAALKENLEVVTWDLNSFDYEGRTPQKIVEWVLANAKAGADILMHDSGRGGDRTSKALPMIIEGYKKRNIGFDSICN